MINELFDKLSTISRWLYTVSTWNKSELMSYGLHYTALFEEKTSSQLHPQL